MSEVIRDAIIRLKLETQKAKLEAPDVSSINRGYESQAKAAKEVQKVVVENQRVIKESTEHHKVFGLEAFKSFKHATEGTIQFARGIALMTASGEEDTRKLLESFAKIEAGVSLARGAINLSKFAAGFGPVGVEVAALAAVVGVGTVAWNRYAASAAKAAEELKKIKEANRAAREAETRMQDELERSSAQGKADLTDAIRDPDARRRAQAGELQGLSESDKERAGKIESAKSAIEREKAKAIKARQMEIEAAKPRSMDDLARRGWMDSPENYRKEAERAEKAAGQLRRQQLTEQQGLFDSQSRAKAINEELRSADLANLNRIGSEAGSSGLTTSKYQDIWVRTDDPMKRQQRQDTVDLANTAFAQTARMFGAPVFTQKEITESVATKEKEVNKAADKMAATIVDAMNEISKQIITLKSQLEQANAANGH